MPQLTLRDIANALNLSVSTVSKALRDSYEISKETKDRVVEYARANHYLPNRMAKSLKEGRSGSIGVVVCSIDNNFVSRMLDGIDGACTQAGYDIIIMQSKESLAQERSCLKQLEARGVEGILISPSVETVSFEHLSALKNTGMPMVLFDRVCEQFESDQVGIDNYHAAFQATEHLIINKYRRIAMLNIGPDIHFAAERSAGYRDALKKHLLTYGDTLIRLCGPETGSTLRDSVRRHLQALLDLPEPPDAVLTATDQLSTHSLTVFHELGRRIPDDVALVGFSNMELADVLTPSFSTIHQPAFEIGRLAAEKLIALIDCGGRAEEPEIVRLPARLHIRESSRPKVRIPANG